MIAGAGLAAGLRPLTRGRVGETKHLPGSTMSTP
jgi:hypothetical protein